jgi:hypothetical protein
VSAEPRLDFYAKVVGGSVDPARAEIDGQLRAVLGRPCDDEGLVRLEVRSRDLVGNGPLFAPG